MQGEQPGRALEQEGQPKHHIADDRVLDRMTDAVMEPRTAATGIFDVPARDRSIDELADVLADGAGNRCAQQEVTALLQRARLAVKTALTKGTKSTSVD